MIEKYARNSHKEYTMFMYNIMWNRDNQKVLYLYKTKERKQNYITKIFMWIDKKYIKEIKMWGKSSSIYKIIISNFCGRTIEIKFKKEKPIVRNTILYLDDIQQLQNKKGETKNESNNDYYTTKINNLITKNCQYNEHFCRKDAQNNKIIEHLEEDNG